MADALAGLRRFNYERIYLRPESTGEARLVIDMLHALVEHYISHPQSLPDGAEPSDDPLLRAVAYVDGMTDRFACQQATILLGWPREKLPRGLDID